MVSVPYNVAWSLDDRGRDVPDDAEAMRQAVEWLRQRASEADDDADKARLLGLAGAYARTVGDLDASVALLSDALARAGPDERLRAVLRVRLAHTHQWAEAFAASNEIFAELLEACAADPALSDLADFVHQHHGKNLLDQGRAAEAVAHFEQALAIRQRKGDEGLLASTKQALNLARRATVAPDPHR